MSQLGCASAGRSTAAHKAGLKAVRIHPAQRKPATAGGNAYNEQYSQFSPASAWLENS